MFEVVVTAKRAEADSICTFELARPDGAQLPPFSAGAHIDVQVGEGIVRQYSLCNNPRDRHRYLIGVLREATSRGGSLAMHDRIGQGHRIRISEPRNHFPLAHGAARSLLFAGGVGVTPILCMAERLADSGADFEMHYCARSRARMAFLERILKSSFASRVHFHLDDGSDEQKLNAAPLLANPMPGTHLYVCGPGGFMNYVLGAAEQAGWSGSSVHREYFSAPTSASPASARDSEFEVRIASSGQVITIPPDSSVLQVLARHGIEIPVSCEAGVCGTCITRVLEGEPDHRDVYMTDAEHAANDQFTPCCSRAKSKRLILDL
jgi:vanillate O-demethylase ferredoxin subunit